METLRLHAGDLVHLAPELTLVISAVILSLLDLLMPSRMSRNLIGWLSLVAIAISAAFVIRDLNPVQTVELLNQSYRVDDFGNIMKLIFLAGTGLVVLTGLGFVKDKEIAHKGELYYLILAAALGGMIMASSGDLITLFVGLELLSITSYILVALQKRSLQSNEGAFKYIVLGSISSAMILYGMSFLYGMSGSTNLAEINLALTEYIGSYEMLAYVAFFLLLAGFGFKIAAAPFHSWAPDVYQGAPTPVTAFLATVSKAAAFAILFRVMYVVFDNGEFFSETLHKDAFLALMVLAAISMIVGNFTALRQQNVKRLLAYSGIANSGYLLVPIAIQISNVHASNMTEFMYYLIAYLFMNMGAFTILMLIQRASGREDMEAFSGLYYRAPWTAIAMVIFLLSLAGIPITGGFFGKLFIILGALSGKMFWLAVIMMVTSVVSFYYYFKLMKMMFMRSAPEGGSEVRVPAALGIVVWICAVATVLLGLFPNGVTDFIEKVLAIQFDLYIY